MRELAARAVIGAIERGLLSDDIVRRLIRRLLKQRVDIFSQDSPSDVERVVADFVAMQSSSPVAESTDIANDQHYEVPAEFFLKMLGPRLKYSCCEWSQSTTLSEAENEALSTVCERAEVADGMHLLELGCGWGSLTLWLAEKYPEARMTAVSNSNSQREFIIRRAEEMGVASRLNVVTCDMNSFQTENNQFDRVLSIEMFEHMRNYSVLLERASNWLKPEGKLFVHIFCHQTHPYVFETEGALNWMGRHFFSGGIMPSWNLFYSHCQHLAVEDKWKVCGKQYSQTLDAWLQQMDENHDRIMEIFSNTYGQQNATRWFMRWRVFLMACSELFGYSGGDEWHVAHYRLSRSH